MTQRRLGAGFMLVSLLISVAFVLVASVVGARADGTVIKPWQGCFGEASGARTSQQIGAIQAGDLSATLAGFGIGVGCDLQVDKIVVGGFARYDFTSDSTWTAGGRLGYAINPYLLPYVLGGISEASKDTTTAAGLVGIAASAKFLVGGGIETFAIGDHLTLFGEATTTVAHQGSDPTSQDTTFRLGLRYRIGGGVSIDDAIKGMVP